MVSQKMFKGHIETLPPNGIFVFGANPQGRHGSGNAKKALDFGAVYGKIGMQGQTYALVTKELRVEEHPSISRNVIISQIELLYIVARLMPEKDFYIAYTNSNNNLCGYTSQELADMFAVAGKNGGIPNNIVFEESFADLMV